LRGVILREVFPVGEEHDGTLGHVETPQRVPHVDFTIG
jgi:hypothetical protein